jgi:hypothetical protein
MLVSACSSDPAAPDTPELELEATLEQLAAEANSAGDVDAAAAFGDGLLAIRLGVRPTELEVTVAGQSARYHAIVTGVAQLADDGTTIIRRSLVAWLGRPRPEAILQVTSLSDESAFGFPSDLAVPAAPVGRARGTWVNLPRGHTFVGTSGPASVALVSIGDQCPALPPDSRLRCAVARYEVSIDGVFHLLPRRDARHADQTTRIEISAAGGVAGVVVTR